MLHYIITILLGFILTPIFGQTINDKGDVKPIKDTSQIKIIIRDGFQGEPSCYLNGKKIDLKKYFITPDNVKEISIIKSEHEINLFGDTAKGGLVLITTKPGLKLLTLIQLLKYNGVDYHKLKLSSIQIDSNPISDTTFLLDSKVQVIKFYKGFAEEPKTTPKKEDLIGVSIYTKGVR